MARKIGKCRGDISGVARISSSTRSYAPPDPSADTPQTLSMFYELRLCARSAALIASSWLLPARSARRYAAISAATRRSLALCGGSASRMRSTSSAASRSSVARSSFALLVSVAFMLRSPHSDRAHKLATLSAPHAGKARWLSGGRCRAPVLSV